MTIFNSFKSHSLHRSFEFKVLLSKIDVKPRLIRQILLLQEFNLENRGNKKAQNLANDHLSWLESPNLEKLDEAEINDGFPKERLYGIQEVSELESPWLTNVANYLITRVFPGYMIHQEKKKRKFFARLKYNFQEDPFFF